MFITLLSGQRLGPGMRVSVSTSDSRSAGDYYEVDVTWVAPDSSTQTLVRGTWDATSSSLFVVLGYANASSPAGGRPTVLSPSIGAPDGATCTATAYHITSSGTIVSTSSGVSVAWDPDTGIYGLLFLYGLASNNSEILAAVKKTITAPGQQ